jgi:hypothetical protein
MSWDQVRLTAKDLMTLSRMTNQVNADAIINFGDTLAYECGYASALKEDQCLFLGDATSTYGGITGVRQKLTNKWTAATAGTITGITKASSTTLASLALADFENAVGSLCRSTRTRQRGVGLPPLLLPGRSWSSCLLAAGGNTRWRSRTATAARARCSSATRSSSARCSRAPRRRRPCSPCSVISARRQLRRPPAEHHQLQRARHVGGQSVFERNEVAVRAVERFDINVHDVGDGTTPGPSSRSPPADRGVRRAVLSLLPSTITRNFQ